MHSVLRGVYSAPSRTEGRRREEQIQLHPSAAALPEAHVIFRRNTVGLRTKEVRAHRHTSCPHCGLVFFGFFLTSCRCIVTLIWSNLRSNRYVRFFVVFFENAAYHCRHSSSELKGLKKSANDYTAGVDFFPSVRARLGKSFTLF